MVVKFPAPVLSVAADAVRDLEGRDALSGLWTLFTKCKESLQDGRRLENISWRLWYRELMLLEEERKSFLSNNVPLSSEKENLHQEELVLDEKFAYQPPTPSEAVPILPPPYSARDSAAQRNSSPNSPHLLAELSTSPVPSPSSPAQVLFSPLLIPSSSEHKRRSSSSTSTTQSRRGSFVNGIGKIIVEMLPTSSSASGSSDASSSSDSSKGGMAALFLPGPVLSRRSTSVSTSSPDSSSSGDSEVSKVNSADFVIVGTQLRLDPKIQMTPIAAVGSSSPASSHSLPLPPSILPVANLTTVRPRRCSIPEPPQTQTLQSLQFQNNASCLPTPEMEEAEPGLRINSSTNQNSHQLASSSSISVSSSSSASSTTTVPAPLPVAIAAISHSVSSTSNTSNDSVDNSKSTTTNESSLPVLQAPYTGPPSPSLSDSYALAHPGEVEVKEVGLLPSLSSTIALSNASLHQTHSEPHSPPQLLSPAPQMPPFSTSSFQVPIMNAPSSSSSTHPEPPKLVIVNPTPNPTPHPTPPATPLLGGTIGPGGIIKSQWLTLPKGTAGAGARQHHVLQAAQKQLNQMQAFLPQHSALRLQPPVAASGVPTTAAAAGAPKTDTAVSALDRSRSVTMPTTGGLGLLDSEPRLSSPEVQQRGYAAEESSVNVIPDVPRNKPLDADTILNRATLSLSSSRPSPVISPIHAESSTTELRQEPEGSTSIAPSLRSSVEREEGRNRMGNRHSISSTTSSNHSQISDKSSGSGRAASTTTTNTTLLSSSEADHLRVTEKVATKGLGSLSTIQSLSTLTDREKELAADVTKENWDAVEYDIISNEEALDDEDATPLSPLPPPGGLAMSPRSDRRTKRNSAPTPATSSALLALSPTSSTSGPVSGQPPSPRSNIVALQQHHASRRVTTAGGGLARRASNGRSTSRSRSTGGSSVGNSRSRSREPGVGLGAFGMTSAGNAPPGVATARKAHHITSGRGRAKIVVGRNTSTKARVALRRNSSGLNGGGTAATAEAEALEQELQREQEEKEKTERMRAGALERERKRSLENMEDLRRVDEEGVKVAKQRKEREERRRRQEASEALAGEIVGSSSKRHLKFNIGSNSDQGSGLDSKSAESTSDTSGGRHGAGRGGRGEDPRLELSTQSKVKERQREMDQQEMAQQLQRQLQLEQQKQQQQPPPILNHHDHLSKDQRNLQQHLQRQMSKQQLHQLQKMQQLHHQQHQNQSTIIHQHQPQQYQQRFQNHQQVQQLAQGLTSSSRQASPQQFDRGQVNNEGRVGESRKSKGKEKEVVLLSPKPTKSTSKVNVAVDDDLAAKVKQSLAAPLLPQNKRTIVLATSESEFETDSEDDGSWSSEEMAGDEAAQQRAREEQLGQQELQRQYQQQQQLQLQRQWQQQQLQENLQQQQQPVRPRPPAVQRTQSSHYPAPNARGGGRQQRQSQANTQAMMEKAALEVQRQRDMFVKLPASSFQDLAKARTRSVGLLTQLMNPNPEIFPADHPYRRGFSSGEIRLAGGAPVTPMRPLAPAPHQPARAANKRAPAAVDEGRLSHHRRTTDVDGQRPPGGPGPSRSNFSPPSRALGLQRTKSAAAIPLSSQIVAGSVSTKAPPTIDLSSAMPTNMHSNGSSGGYRLKGPPEGEELEEDSGSEVDSGVSKSVVQEKLKALAQRQGIVPTMQRNADLAFRTYQAAGPGDDDDVPQWAKISRPPQPLTRSQSQGQAQRRRTQNGLHFTQIGPDEPSNNPPAAPIPLGYPYNLPIQAPPSTPRTTRRLMLSTELPESLRRNLLWERQVSKVNLTGPKRSASGGGSRNSILGGLQPLTTAPSMIQLHAKGTGPPGNASDNDAELRRAVGALDEQERQEREEKKRRAMARNKSWANDYHYSGW